jgi:Mn-dependent DtxR family transcriptional regulator
VVSAQTVAKELAVSEPTARNTIATLQEMGLLDEQTGHARNRTYGYVPYINILVEDTLSAPG